VNRRAPLIAGGVIAVVAVLLVVILVLPKMGQVGEAEDDLSTAQDQELTLEAQLQALQQAQSAAPETEREIAQIEEQIPPTADLPTIFNLLQGAADRSAVDFFSFSPGTPVADPSNQFSVIPSQITVTGNYFALDEFLFLMETLPRAAKVQGITVTPASEAGTTVPTSSLSMAITLELYTTDISAGPASLPGPTAGAGSAPSGATGSTSTTGEAT
jgi:Tfp pilus assembly protein PilO